MSTPFSRRFFLGTGAAAIAAPSLLVRAGANTVGNFTTTHAPFAEVEIDSGRIRGGHSRGALAFKGIPYAGSVAGKNRFKAPPPVTPWKGVRDATALGPPALQTPNTTYGENEPAYSEDCLVLNVWTSAVKDGGKRPVMVFCHGGGFESGSGGHRVQDGGHLASTYDVVVVTMNHRLGLLGYLYLGELGGADHGYVANPSMLDIAASLQWIKRNIATFGGDPDNVFVFGESGGGLKTCTLMAMPAAHGLFHKAGVQSSTMLRGISKDMATENARRVLAGLDLGPQDLGKLVDVPADKLLAIQFAGSKGPLGTPTREWRASNPNPPSPLKDDFGPGDWGPVVDGTVLPRGPFSPDATPLSADMPLLIGNGRDEAAFFEMGNPAFFNMDDAALKRWAQKTLGSLAGSVLAEYEKTRPNATATERGIAIETAIRSGNHVVIVADRKSQQPAPVYRYRNDYQSNHQIPGTDWTLRAGHATDIATTFYNYDIPDLQGNGPGLAEASKAISGYFASFARNGVPTAAGQPAWPRYDTTRRPVMLLNAQCHVANDPGGEERQFWQSLTSRA
jgi:para-nitrobenzyl esterase